MTPGEIITEPGDIELNAGRARATVIVANTGDRPIQVGSHYHFFETNQSLRFAREQARGMRLNIAAGTAVRFEPGQTRTVELVEFAGARQVFGFQGLVMGALDKAREKKASGQQARAVAPKKPTSRRTPSTKATRAKKS